MSQSKILLEVLQGYLRKKNKNFKIAAVVVVGICLAVISLAAIFPADSDDTGSIISMYVIVGLAVAGAVAMIYYSSKELKKYHSENCLLVEAFENKNRDNYLVWVYPQETKRTQNGVNVGKSYALIFKAFDHEEYFVPIGGKEHYKFITMMQVELPNITYGFSEAKKSLYVKDPNNLIVKN